MARVVFFFSRSHYYIPKNLYLEYKCEISFRGHKKIQSQFHTYQAMEKYFGMREKEVEKYSKLIWKQCCGIFNFYTMDYFNAIANIQMKSILKLNM